MPVSRKRKSKTKDKTATVRPEKIKAIAERLPIYRTRRFRYAAIALGAVAVAAGGLVLRHYSSTVPVCLKSDERYLPKEVDLFAALGTANVPLTTAEIRQTILDGLNIELAKVRDKDAGPILARRTGTIVGRYRGGIFAVDTNALGGPARGLPEGNTIILKDRWGKTTEVQVGLNDLFELKGNEFSIGGRTFKFDDYADRMQMAGSQVTIVPNGRVFYRFVGKSASHACTP